MTDSASTVRALSCPQCGGTIALRAAGSSVSLVCEHCGSTLDATDPDLKIIAAAHEIFRRPEIPLGTRAELRGVQWEVVGYLERWAGSGWSEYLLFNPYRGYAFLVDDGRRFHLGRLLNILPRRADEGVESDGAHFRPVDDAYRAEVTFVVGEFYWRVAVGERVTVRDYARPNAMLSCEENESERTWTRLDLLDWGEAESALGIGARSRDGVPSPDEESPWWVWLKEALVIAGVALFLLLAVIVPFGGGSRHIAGGEAQAVLDGPEQTIVIRNIGVPAPRNRVQITASSPDLDNDWIDIDYTLVDQKTGSSYDAYALAEHYSGVSGGDSWSEGERRPMIALASIPRGTYDLVITIKASRWRESYWAEGESHYAPISFRVDAGGVFGANLLIACILILIWPGYLLVRHYGFVKRRAEGS
jgi:hypothetical protein